MTLSASAVSLGYGDQNVISGLDCTIPEGQVTAIVGANASGKSTLLLAMARLLKPSSGAIVLDGVSIQRLPTREVARRLGLLPQGPSAPEGMAVEDLVLRGRYPHRRPLLPPTAHDREWVEWALATTKVTELRDRPIDRLSGGQRQRAWIAMALAQGTDKLLLDEPTTYLDLAHQYDVLELLADLNRSLGRTVVLVLHDLNQAARYAHNLVALDDGAIYAAGPPSEVVTEAMVADVFGIDVRVIADPVVGTPMCVPLGRSAAFGMPGAGTSPRVEA